LGLPRPSFRTVLDQFLPVDEATKRMQGSSSLCQPPIELSTSESRVGGQAEASKSLHCRAVWTTSSASRLRHHIPFMQSWSYKSLSGQLYAMYALQQTGATSKSFRKASGNNTSIKQPPKSPLRCAMEGLCPAQCRRGDAVGLKAKLSCLLAAL